MSGKIFLGYVAQPRRCDGKLNSLMRGNTGKTALFSVPGDAWRAIHGCGVVHPRYGKQEDYPTLYDLGE